MYVVDSLNHPIQVFLENQTHGTTIARIFDIDAIDSTTRKEFYSVAWESMHIANEYESSYFVKGK